MQGGAGGLCLVLSYLGNKGIYTYLGYNQRGLGGLGGSWVLQSMCNSHEWMNFEYLIELSVEVIRALLFWTIDYSYH